MIRSLFTGTSGLRTHQTRLDVVGNNIANVNTNGYKESRANFRETILQTLSAPGAATATRGSINPKQVGLGTTTASVDPDFSQGNLEVTGRNSDVAVEGQGFFVIDVDGQSYYTRNGAFNVDQSGRLVTLSGGNYVQGWNADRDGVLDRTAPVQGIQVPIGALTLARVTTKVDYVGNLDAVQLGFAQSLDTQGRITTNSMLGGAQTFLITPQDPTIVAQTVTVPQIQRGGAYTSDARELDFQVLSNLLATDTIRITRTNAGGGTTTATFTPTAGNYSNSTTYVDNFVADWNATAGQIVYAVKESPTAVRFYEYDPTAVPPNTGGQGVDSSFAFDPAPASTATAATIRGLGMRSGVYETMGAATSPDPEYLALVTATAVNVVAPPPNAAATTDGSGRLTFTSTLPGLGGRLTLSDQAGSTLINDVFGLPSQFVDIKTYRTSVVVYDTLGVAHTVNLDINRVGNTRTWEYLATDESGFNIMPPPATSGTLSFSSIGRSQTSSATVELNLTSGATTPQSVQLNLGDLTQFSGDSTVTAADQDGVAMGTLESYTISPDGVISGEFTNGLNQTLAQFGLATFNNAGGLDRAGASLWKETVASGTAQVGAPESAARGKTVQGSLEASNVDLANEFTQLIVAERGFQANARIITTSDEILQDLTNLKR